MITENRIRIDQRIALNASMGEIMPINGRIVIDGRYSREAYEASIEFLRGIREDLRNALDAKIEEMKKIAERTV